jgi:hypothetical protein
MATKRPATVRMGLTAMSHFDVLPGVGGEALETSPAAEANTLAGH